MEKEEKKADLEQLLNSLIEKGWKPFGEKEIKNIKILGIKAKRWDFVCQIPGGISKHCTCRELTAKESGLWQFVRENGMAKDVSPQILMWQRVADRELSKFIGYNDYQYRLIESALCDEDKLEEFLLSNIKVEGND